MKEGSRVKGKGDEKRVVDMRGDGKREKGGNG